MKSAFKKTLCTVMASIMLAPSLSSLCVSAQNTETLRSSEYSVDYSDPQSNYNVTVSPSELLSMLCTDTLDDSEAEYLDTYFEAAFIYSPDISAENVSVSVSDGQICVTARKRPYTAQNGTQIVWIPVNAVYEGNTIQLLPTGGDLYSCVLTLEEAQTVTVSYKCEIELPSGYVSDLSSFANSDALKSAKILEEHEEALSSYLDSIARYETYLSELSEHENAVAAYKEYLGELEIYQKSLTEYNAYLTALADYNTKLAAYEKYVLEYDAYLIAKAEYEKAYEKNMVEYEKYRVYLENLSKIRASMSYMESLFIKPTNGVGPIFNALQNKDLVSMIEKYDDELVNFYGVKRKDIEDMRTVSDELNELLHGYSDARAVSEEEAFAFYKAHYTEITQKFQYLYDKMTAILTPTIYVHMCAWTEIEYKNDPEMASYKKWRIRNVLCHIYLICRGLDDSVTADNTWTFYLENGKTYTYNFSDLLSQNVILTDTDSACPDALEWWKGEIPEASLPTAPVRPTEVIKPTEPLTVAKPTEPVTVSKPGEAPKEVSAPGTRPKIDSYDLVLRTQQYFGDSIPAVHQVSDTQTVSFGTTVERAFSADGSNINAYYTYDGKLLSVNTEPLPPLRTQTTQYSYTFDGWDMTYTDSGMLYYPRYNTQTRTYTVSFRLSDSDTPLYTREYEYGVIPTFEGALPQKEQTNTSVYEFDGWYPSISPVSRDTEYVAQFAETPRMYTVRFNILGDVTERSLSYGALITLPPVKHTRYIEGACYTFVGWDNNATTVTENMEYTALFEKTDLVLLPEASDGELEIYDTGTSLVITTDAESVDISGLLKYASALGREITVVTEHYTLRVTSEAVKSLRTYRAKTFSVLLSENGVGYAFTSNGKEVLFLGDVRMSLAHGLTETAGMYVSRDKASTVPCSQNGEYAEFSAKASSFYKIEKYRSLTLESAENGAVFADGHFYRAGDTVTLELLPNAEYTVSKVLLTCADGEITDITGQSSFIMPDSDVKINVEFSQIQYTVSFICNGETVSSELYVLGDTIIIPSIPLSFEKDGFLYSFIGWSEPISIVTGNAVFTAKYLALRIDLVEEIDTQTAVDKVVKSQLLPLLGAIGLTAALVVGITVPLVRSKKAKKKADIAHKEENTDE